MNPRTRWTVNGALIGAAPGFIAVGLVWLLAGCPGSPGQPGMVCYDIERLLFRTAWIATAGGTVIGGLAGAWLGARRAS